jgi:hypothetical protein
MSIGTSAAIDGTPDEQVGYLASEEYASRITSPNSPPHSGSGSQTYNTSRLKEEITSDVLLNQQTSENALADETEDEDVIHVGPPSGDLGNEDLGPQGSNMSDYGGRMDDLSYSAPILAPDEVAKEPATEHLQPAVSPYQERKSSSYFAIGDLERSGSRSSSRPTSTPASRSGSRPNSIIGGVAGFARYALHDDHEELSTPLEDVEEYEPLFPDDEKGEGSKNTTDRPKRPELNAMKSSASSIRSQRRKFPSQDIWEDAPSRAQLQATVTTPQLPEDGQDTTKDSREKTETSPAAATGRYQEDEGEKNSSFLPQETQDWANPKFKDEMNNSRPKQRFPSKDIWEDSPESLQLRTTVSTSQIGESKNVPDVPERPMGDAVTRTQEKSVDGEELGSEEGRSLVETKPALEKPTPPPRPIRGKELAVGAAGVQPTIPARPHRIRNLPPADIPPVPAKTSPPVSRGLHNRAVPPPPSKADDDGTADPTSSPSERKAPVLPERSKPQIPTRPAKPVTKKSGDSVNTGPSVKAAPTSGMEGSSSTRPVPPTAKPKPAVPSRPNGGKLAAIKAGFLSDLDKRLQQGPTAPKPKGEPTEEQVVEEKAPLSDARKGRARGPARRKPAASPSGNPEESSDQKDPQKFDISIPFTIWQIAEDGHIVVASGDDIATPEPMGGPEKADINPTSTLATNTTREKAYLPEDIATEDPDPEIAKGSNTAVAESPTVEGVGVVDEMATTFHESVVEPRGTSVVSEASQTSEQVTHTDMASKGNPVANISGKTPKEGDMVAEETST